MRRHLSSLVTGIVYVNCVPTHSLPGYVVVGGGYKVYLSFLVVFMV